mmetsp:Transcript_81143/g.211741  ORF Transcript_81143/g.211741 Transcript_81143/m.211741 type:complete len:249 (-) Transcript_81143:86-832(-)
MNTELFPTERAPSSAARLYTARWTAPHRAARHLLQRARAVTGRTGSRGHREAAIWTGQRTRMRYRRYGGIVPSGRGRPTQYGLSCTSKSAPRSWHTPRTTSISASLKVAITHVPRVPWMTLVSILRQSTSGIVHSGWSPSVNAQGTCASAVRSRTRNCSPIRGPYLRATYRSFWRQYPPFRSQSWTSVPRIDTAAPQPLGKRSDRKAASSGTSCTLPQKGRPTESTPPASSGSPSSQPWSARNSNMAW